MLSSRDSSNFRFQALTDLCLEINIRLNNAIFANKFRKKEEKIKQEMKISQDYDFFMPEQVEIQDETDHFNVENENILNKIKKVILKNLRPKPQKKLRPKLKPTKTLFRNCSLI